MRHLFAATCLTPVVLLAAPAAAQTVISGASTTPVSTSTANGGAPSDVQISSTGSLKPTASPAVTVDSNNNVDNEGTIQITDVNNAVGILIQPGRTTNITNGGTIQIDESFTAADTNGDGIADPPYASGTGRYGIHALGAMTGDIVNSGTITIKGNASAGIALDGPLTGSITSSGAITVTGDNGFALHAGDVSGSVSVGSGAISVLGQGSVGVALDGNVGGQVTFQGGVSATGFATTTTGATNAADLLLGGPAVRIQGNVGGGLLFAEAPGTSTTNPDLNNDGIPDSGEGTASITSFGSAPAVQIGSGKAITIGALSAGAANGSGILNEGSITGSGVDAGFSGTAMQIGGFGGNVTVTGGMTNTGSIAGGALDSNATGIRIGSGANVGTLVNSGNITAASAPSAATVAVQGIAIDAGGSLTSIVNSGRIGAQITGTAGTATAIADRSGTLVSVQNQGSILASVPTGVSGIAIDLSANTTGATVRQIASASGAAAPQIVGDIRFGGGDNLLDLEAGSFTGNTSFGSGSSNQVTLSGTAQQIGNVDFGGGAGSLTLADTAMLQGALSNAGNVAVAVNGGTLNLTNNGTVSIASLSVGPQGSFTVNVDGAAGTHTLYDVAGQASFEAGAKVNVKLTSVGGDNGSFVILHAGSLSGADQLTSAGAVVPFLFDTSLSVDQAAGDISLNVTRKSAAELGLNRSESAIFDAATQAIDSDSAIAGVFLDATDAATLQSGFRQMLPDHAGAVFQSVAQGSRAEMRALQDPMTPLVDMGGWGIQFQQVAWGENKGMGDTDSYRIVGWGVGAGPEFRVGGLGSVGLTASYLSGTVKDGAVEDQINSNEYELAAYWRGHWRGLRTFARVSAGYVTLGSNRFFLENDGTTSVSRTAHGSWKGVAMTGAAGLSYEVHSGAFSLRPAVSIDYVRLKEDSYAETGGGNAFDLSIDSRTSHEEGVNATLTAGYDILRPDSPDSARVRLELEGGRRQLIESAPGATTAHFAGGADFTLLPDTRDSGWLGRFRLLAGTADFQGGGEIGTEEQQGRQAVALRANVMIRF